MTPTDELSSLRAQLEQAKNRNRELETHCRLCDTENGWAKECAALRAENKKLRELLRYGARLVVQFGSSIEQEPQAEAFSADVERHLAQSDAPGAGKAIAIQVPALTKEQQQQPSPVPVIPWKDYGNPRQG